MSGHTPVCEDEAKVKPHSPPKRRKLGKARRGEVLSEVCVIADRWKLNEMI